MNPAATSPLDPVDLAALRAAFLREEKPAGAGGILTVLVLILVLSQLVGDDPFSAEGLRWLVLSSGVIAFHEAGHWAAMRAFGFRDLRVFIVPLVGGLASGSKRGAPAWQHALVSLAGPLPGIVLGLGIAASSLVTGSELARELALVLVVINALNLLPIPPLDGGRLLQDLIGSRSRILAVTGPWIAGVAALGLALALRSLFLGFLALGQLAGAGHRSRVAREAFALRRAGVSISAEPAEVTDAQLVELFRRAETIAPSPAHVVAAVRSLHDDASRAPPGLAATVGLAALWAGGFALALIAGVIAAPGPDG